MYLFVRTNSFTNIFTHSNNPIFIPMETSILTAILKLKSIFLLSTLPQSSLQLLAAAGQEKSGTKSVTILFRNI